MANLEDTQRRFPSCSKDGMRTKENLDLEDDGSSTSRLSFDPLSIPRSLGSLNPQETPERKVAALKTLLETDLVGADVKWSLFVAASHSYRYDSCIKPFPPMYIKNECKDIDALRETIERVPPFMIILHELRKPEVYQNFADAVDLLYWVLVRLRDPIIKSVNKDCYESVLRRVPSEMSVAAPNLIFQVASAKHSPSEERWKVTSHRHTTFYAYHGSRLENFHSIIHHGLQQSMCKKCMFGKGVYLSSELGVSLPYSPMGYGWGASVLGSELSCIALCELINHPDVKRGDSGDAASNTRTDTIGGTVPDKYYLLINSDLVRVRYLLVYCQDLSSSRDKDRRGLIGWFKRHKLLTFVIGYVVLLASVGLSHNKYVEKYYRSFIQKVGFQ
ncbi:protein mono-ADP-ribosyltransferase PARP16 [Athalia rosae]|uniref:protein mono-ADP-ribosyltransferase PARP16 n=1 Tax=Athalia rosae TaxID=37344 RepID=UPI0006263343|nr:protein mono-ADP-ribosyltransferase PARP16 [Athalia rosae]XP_012254240.1 protein mono-ADP-ribosyltransferase PARP16 [Athalia rosae]XP_012254242.1 protein mono-ADP-ribosyltransferase PARP16 [Athalia rosae]XP_020707486.1 protein mono-ADP-ribosyltransferase PARP16 [Athalia rosae]